MPINARFIPPPPASPWSLEDAKKWLKTRLSEGEKCPCCSQFAKIYRRKIHSTMAASIISMYRSGGLGWVHVPSVAGDACEAGKLRYWGLVEEERERRPDGGRSGWWRVTELGGSFVRAELLVKKYALIYDGRCLGLEGEMISIRDSLGSRFSYEDLMVGV